MFFFEKKNQKTFVRFPLVPLRGLCSRWIASLALTGKGQGHQEQKFFAELFFKKATAFFVLESKHMVE